MVTTWKTISAKITDETYGVMKLLCEKDKIKPNEFIRKSIEKNITEFFPNLGENKFEYDLESDSFKWVIYTGANSPLLIANNLGPFFIENMHTALNSAIKNRHSLLNKMGKNRVALPHAITKFRKN
jgi:hypothetical protein